MSLWQTYLINSLEKTFYDHSTIVVIRFIFDEFQDDLSLAMPLIDTFDRQFKREDYPWDHWAAVGICMDVLNKVIQAHK